MADRFHAPAKSLSLRVQWHKGGPKSHWALSHRTITLRYGKGWRKARSTFAHELGYASHHDHPVTEHVPHARQERRADEWAAGFLISPDDYSAAESLVGVSPGALDEENGATTHMIRAWRGHFERTTTK